MTNKSRICIAEDHTLLRAGICSLLASNPNLEVVDEVGDGLDLIESVKKHCPDLVIMDISMPRMRGLEAIQQIKARYPEKRYLC